MFWIDISVFLRNGNYKLSIKDIFILEKTESRKYGVNLSEFCQFSAKEKSAHSDLLRIKMNAIFSVMIYVGSAVYKVFWCIELYIFCFCCNSGIITFQDALSNSDIVRIILKKILSSVGLLHDIR